MPLSLRIASWNVNSLKIRLEQVLTWLESTQVDVLALQETKLIDPDFPALIFKERGYEVCFSGQKAYNGMAFISRYPLEEISAGLPLFADEQKRVLAASVQGVRIINLYVPNGASVSSEKFLYKLAWLQATKQFLGETLKQYPRVVVLGDFNIAPAEIDVHDPLLWQDSVLFSIPEREAFAELLELGLHDSFRSLFPEEQVFSWWDYRAAAFRRNLGLRIDHILLSSALLPLCQSAQIDKEPRRWPRPSDHAPIWISIKE